MERWLEKLGNKCKTPSALRLALLFFMVTGMVLLYIQSREPAVVVSQENVEAVAVETKMEQPESESVIDEEEVGDIFVHVSGQVNCPGVVCLRVGSRVYEAVEMAGGMTSDGDMESVNLAAVLVDQQKIVVGSIEERIAAVTAGSDPYPAALEETSVALEEIQGKININTATKAQLESLPGIGPVIAGNIIEYRQNNGGFKTIEEIKNVSRIGDLTFSNIQELIGVR